MAVKIIKFNSAVGGRNRVGAFYVLMERLAKTNQFLSQQLAKLSGE
jgi:hypothetical protein